MFFPSFLYKSAAEGMLGMLSNLIVCLTVLWKLFTSSFLFFFFPFRLPDSELACPTDTTIPVVYFQNRQHTRTVSKMYKQNSFKFQHI